MKLIVGLWNPWAEYAKTRHNIWFMIVDDFVEYGKMEGWKSGKMGGEILETVIDGQKVIFLKPMEFMNRSWWAVAAVANFYKIAPKDILVIHDEIDLPVGKIQMKLWWSSAGHNWLKSIIEKLWTKDPAKDGAGFYRLRIGVDRPADKAQVVDYVLGTFSQAEKLALQDKFGEIFDSIHVFLSH